MHDSSLTAVRQAISGSADSLNAFADLGVSATFIANSDTRSQIIRRLTTEINSASINLCNVVANLESDDFAKEFLPASDAFTEQIDRMLRDNDFTVSACQLAVRAWTKAVDQIVLFLRLPQYASQEWSQEIIEAQSQYRSFIQNLVDAPRSTSA